MSLRDGPAPSNPSQPWGVVGKRPPTCEGCPAHPTSLGWVPPIGPTTATIALIGQGPGREEAYESIPFVGASGRMLDRWLMHAGLSREALHITNTVWCHLPGNRPPTLTETTHCWDHHVGPTLHSLPNLRVVVPVGIAAQRLLLWSEGPGERLVGGVYRVRLPAVPLYPNSPATL
jgi:DNA polymerase